MDEEKIISSATQAGMGVAGGVAASLLNANTPHIAYRGLFNAGATGSRVAVDAVRNGAGVVQAVGAGAVAVGSASLASASAAVAATTAVAVAAAPYIAVAAVGYGLYKLFWED